MKPLYDPCDPQQIMDDDLFFNEVAHRNEPRRSHELLVARLQELEARENTAPWLPHVERVWPAAA